MRISAALALGPAAELISIVGGGGKSSLMFALARELPGRVLLTTTTRIFAAQVHDAPSWCSLSDPDWERHVAEGSGDLLLVGELEGERARGVPPELPGELLRKGRFAHVVIEADGSRMLPAKAPADHEPVVPEDTTVLVAVAGIDALKHPLRQAVHRPELVAAITGTDLDAPLSEHELGALLASSRGGMKSRPDSARTCVLINKVELEDRERAKRVALAALETRAIERAAYGALQGDADGWSALEWGDGEIG